MFFIEQTCNKRYRFYKKIFSINLNSFKITSQSFYAKVSMSVPHRLFGKCRISLLLKFDVYFKVAIFGWQGL